MAKKNRIIKFEYLPASWGLKGKAFDEAKAYYELTGEDLDRALVDIRSTEKEKDHLSLDLKYKKKTRYEYLSEMAKLNGVYDAYMELILKLENNLLTQEEYDVAKMCLDFPLDDTIERKLCQLELDLKYSRINKNEFEKETATVKNEPWVAVLESDFVANEGVNGFNMELDWNEQFVEMLRANGYEGYQDEQIVEQWFSDVCREQVLEMSNQPLPFNTNIVR